jgi:hypothetical protein
LLQRSGGRRPIHCGRQIGAIAQASTALHQIAAEKDTVRGQKAHSNPKEFWAEKINYLDIEIKDWSHSGAKRGKCAQKCDVDQASVAPTCGNHHRHQRLSLTPS